MNPSPKPGTAPRRRLLPVAGALLALPLLTLTAVAVAPGFPDSGTSEALLVNGTPAGQESTRQAPAAPASTAAAPAATPPVAAKAATPPVAAKAATPPVAGKGAAPSAGTAISGSYIVTVRADEAGRIRSDARELAADYSGKLGGVWTAALHGFSVRMSAADAERLAHDARVASVQPDLVVTTAGTQSDPSWSLDRVDQPGRTPSGTYDYDNDGSGAHVYVFDTGVRPTHSEFAGRIGGSSPGTDHNDCAGHGTAVASAAAGTAYGVAKKATVHPVRVLGCDGAGAAADALTAIDWVTSTAPRPAVVNMSWSTGPQDTLDNAIRASTASGITYVIAAGNDNNGGCATSPQRVAEAIVVGATDDRDRRAGFSNYGSCLDIFAPGTSIKTGAWTADDATVASSGTSLAAPIVTGAAAVYLAAHPSATPAQVRNALVGCATTGLISDPGTGSPDRLLNTRCGGPAITNPGAQYTAVGQAVTLRKITAPTAVRFAATGLPAGLSINATTGVISGTGTTGGTSTAQVTATDAAGASTTTSFRWTVIVGRGAFTGPGSLCVDNTSSNTTDGNPLQLWPCSSGNGAQLFTVPGNGRFEVQGKCMTSGTRVVLRTCDGSAEQLWFARTSGDVFNGATGRCLTAASANWTAQLSLATCGAGALQMFNAPSGVGVDVVSVENPGFQGTVKGTTIRKAVFASNLDTTQRLTWSATGLPAGLSINAATGMISGTATTSRTSAVTLTVANETGQTGTASFAWQVGEGRILGINGYCADLPNANSTNGNPIQLHTCNGQNSQMWTVRSDGRLEVYAKCVTVADDGVSVVVSDCGTVAAQVWAVSGSTLRHTATGKCLTAPTGDNDVKLTIATCATRAGQVWNLPTAPVVLGAVTKQQWTTSAAPALAFTAQSSRTISRYAATGLPSGVTLNASTGALSGTPTAVGAGEAIVTVTDSAGGIGATSFQWTVMHGQIRNASGWCLDNSRGVTTDGNPILVWRCGDSNTQQWTVRADGGLQVQDGCMTASALITRRSCDGAADKVWQATENGELRNPASGKCLTAPSLAYDVQFTLADCAATELQIWALPTAPRITTPVAQQSVTGTAVSLALGVTYNGGPTPAVTATGLPAGLTVSGTTFSGTPTTPGRYTVSVRAQSTSGVATTSFVWLVIAPGAAGLIIHPGGLCVDRGGPNQSLWLYTCNYTNAQLWTARADGRLEVQNSCMMPLGGGTASGTQVGTGPCSTTDATQVWTVESGNSLRNTASGLCLTAPGPNRLSGLYLGSCSGSTWTLPVRA
ncbi:ricin-type beta-trefoil lectin domain protein [Micromonospora rubida]|uniref:ricin-type beta-trefoil lectin domain protein n=1 Tax=Micromonospora rubida TaxID=2697657 RepID=UPI001378EA3B|nr:ricin-type beta-trefoil lectin domain protein [Micromonospora rubida]NBE81940.1 S8 family serine peptidase [Micromonospora rubida]